MVSLELKSLWYICILFLSLKGICRFENILSYISLHDQRTHWWMFCLYLASLYNRARIIEEVAWLTQLEVVYQTDTFKFWSLAFIETLPISRTQPSDRGRCSMPRASIRNMEVVSPSYCLNVDYMDSFV